MSLNLALARYKLPGFDMPSDLSPASTDFTKKVWLSAVISFSRWTFESVWEASRILRISALYCLSEISICTAQYLGNMFQITSSTGSGGVSPSASKNFRESVLAHTDLRTVGNAVSSPSGKNAAG